MFTYGGFGGSVRCALLTAPLNDLVANISSLKKVLIRNLNAMVFLHGL